LALMLFMQILKLSWFNLVGWRLNPLSIAVDGQTGVLDPGSFTRGVCNERNIPGPVIQAAPLPVSTGSAGKTKSTSTPWLRKRQSFRSKAFPQPAALQRLFRFEAASCRYAPRAGTIDTATPVKV
jgi:hypothetical protein